MSHEIDESTGRAAALAVGEPMWHRLGVVMHRPPESVEEAMQISCTDFPVIEEKVYRVTTAGDVRMIPGHKAITRTDTGSTLAITSEDYELIQYRDAFAGVNPLIDLGIATIETMGAIYGGRAAWALVKINPTFLPEEVKDAFARTKDDIKTYCAIYASHDRSSAIEMYNTDIRWQCRNTIWLTRTNEKGVRLPHRKGANDKLSELASHAWHDIVERYRVISLRAAKLREAPPLTKHQFCDLVLDEIALIPTYDQTKYKDLQRFYTVLEHAEAKRNRVTELFTGGPGHLGDESPWEAYNAAVQYLDHEAKGYGQNKAQSALRGALRMKKTRIYENLATLAA